MIKVVDTSIECWLLWAEVWGMSDSERDYWFRVYKQELPLCCGTSYPRRSI